MKAVPSLEELARDPRRVVEVSPEALPTLIGEAERLKAILFARMLTVKPETPAIAIPPSAYLTTVEAATYAKMRKTRLDWWRRNGCLAAVRLGKGYGYRRVDLDDFMARLSEARQIPNRLAFMCNGLTVNHQPARVRLHDQTKGHKRSRAREDDHLPGSGHT